MQFLISYIFFYPLVITGVKAYVTTKYLETKNITIMENSDRQVQRIVGGRETPIEEVPYTAALLQYGELFCGGSIVSEMYVVSAAHCLMSLKKYISLTIRVGSNYYKSGGEEKEVVYFAMHPRFDENSGDYDCSVFKVDSPFSKTFPYQALTFPLTVPRDGDILLVSGWGAERERGKRSPNLKSVSVTVLPDEVCDAFYRPIGWGVTPTGFCAGYLNGGRDSCKGDSGGPAVRDRVLVGIISLGFGCGRKNIPGIYTNVFDVSGWIKEKIKT